ncbi:thermonuclease family protein [Parahaliea maris]|uniref:Thermonuclease family protein n=1 Tax=Parahaliea maris TaxID=2716870 RepID=A0A5C8ZT32_9GAMM|nr:thermonuclease family protein [Parahaliea maris]TXS90732.1 thermonuclease family protein [Parahaliea maris]
MPRPPFRRKRHPPRQRLGRSPWARGIRNLLLLAVAASALQLLTRGEITWPAVLAERVTATLGRSDSGLRQATDALEQQGQRREGNPLPAFDIRGRVVRVADGDTLSVLDSRGEQHKIRLYGIDSPELDQAGGGAAKGALSKLAYQQQAGVVMVERDDYGRVVGTVYVGNTNLNLAQVRAGQAWWYRYHAPHERALEAAESSAQEQQIGLWAHDNPVPPWNWRREHRR